MIICAALVGDATCSSVYLLSVKPPQPVLMVLGSTANSVNVTWNSTCKGTCRLRYRANGTRVWTQVGSLTQLSALNCLLARGVYVKWVIITWTKSSREWQKPLPDPGV